MRVRSDALLIYSRLSRRMRNSTEAPISWFLVLSKTAFDLSVYFTYATGIQCSCVWSVKLSHAFAMGSLSERLSFKDSRPVLWMTDGLSGPNNGVRLRRDVESAELLISHATKHNILIGSFPPSNFSAGTEKIWLPSVRTDSAPTHILSTLTACLLCKNA